MNGKFVKSKTIAKVLAVLMALTCFTFLNPVEVSAKTKTPESDPAENLDVYVRYSDYGSGDYRCLKTLDYDYFQENSVQETYTFIDSLPVPVADPAEGVYLEDVLAECGIDSNDMTSVRFWCTDGNGKSPNRSYSYDYLFGESRYFYPNIASEGNWAPGFGASVSFASIHLATQHKQRVEPMIAYQDNWQRYQSDEGETNDIDLSYDNLDDSVRYRLVFGLEDLSDYEDGEEVDADAFDSLKWIYRMDVVLDEKAPAPTSISLSDSSMSITAGKTKQLAATLEPEMATTNSLKWSSDNTSAATVSSKGLVTAIAAGAANITCSSSDGSLQKVCAVSVSAASEPEVSGGVGSASDTSVKMTLNKSSAEIAVGSTVQLKATIDSEDSKYAPDLSWKSSDTSVATVNDKGLVTAITPGAATITAKTEDDQAKATCRITVVKAVENLSSSLTDIKGHWAETSIVKLANLGIINGNPDGSFKPDSSVTRAQFVTILIKTMIKEGLLPLDSSAKITDADGHWAESYLSTAIANGILIPQSDGSVSPDRLINREEMSTMLARALKLSSEAAGSSFSDQDSISGWALDSVKALTKNAGITGFPDGSFRPKDNTTKAQAAVAVLRTFNNAGHEL